MLEKHRKTARATSAKTRPTKREQSSNNALEVLMNIENQVKDFAKPKFGRPKLNKIPSNSQGVINLTLSSTTNTEPINNKDMS